MPARGAPHGVLPVMGLFGANASGKSNLLTALVSLRAHVAWSFVGQRPDAPMPFEPFVLRAGGGDEPVHLDIDLMVHGIRHHYGLRHTDHEVVEEWLHAWPAGRRQLLFHRTGADPSDWWLSPALRLGRLRGPVLAATRPNALLLSTAAQFNVESLRPLAGAIVEGVLSESPIVLRGYPIFLPDHPIVQERHRETVLRLLAAADLGVVDIKPMPLRQRDEVLAVLRDKLRPEAFEEVARAFEGEDQAFELWLVHEVAGGGRWSMPPTQESRGTQVLLARLNDLLRVLDQGSLLVVDELDTSLHPDLCRALVGLFSDRRSNPKGAQLLFTSHDRELLGALRRDEVVLVDKDREGVSRLRTAAEFRGLRGRDDRVRAHRDGRMGGVPVLGDLGAIVGRGLAGGT